ncbi:MAG: hypothetical protein IKH04_07275, partial [Kiritimatiellae bacterium]|nr:hypothetical protein [Kiritimatiellia bacterium]
ALWFDVWKRGAVARRVGMGDLTRRIGKGAAHPKMDPYYTTIVKCSRDNFFFVRSVIARSALDL